MRLLALLLAILPLPVLAQEIPPDLSPEVFAVARELRCPVCQGESAAESNSGVAQEMRRIIAEMLEEGRTPEEIKAYFVDRYGEWILYNPPRRGLTLWAWVLPGLVLLFLGYRVFLFFRPRPLPQDLEAEIRKREREP